MTNAMVSLTFAGRELFQYLDEIANAELKDIHKRLEEQLNPEYSTLSIVSPIN